MPRVHQLITISVLLLFGDQLEVYIDILKAENSCPKKQRYQSVEGEPKKVMA